MSYETTCEKLRPFGIRQLRDHETRHGVVHISAPQYDSTVKSYPDAVLTYTDDDDGETITVGSGLELEQRLDDPVTHSGSRASQSLETIRSPSRSTPRDGKIHLFDIKQTQDNLAIWREHEAYSSKTLRDQYAYSSSSSQEQLWFPEPDYEDKATARHASSTSSPPSIRRSASPPMNGVEGPAFDISDLSIPTVTSNEPPSNEAIDGLFTQLMLKRGWSELPERAKEQMAGYTEAKKLALLRQEQPEEDTRVAVSNPSVVLDHHLQPSLDSLEKPLGVFADFLDSTAAVLRKTAQKTRDADTSPIENFLSGMKDILTEVGQLGVEVLQSLETDLTQTRSASTESAPQLPPRDKMEVSTYPQPASLVGPGLSTSVPPQPGPIPNQPLPAKMASGGVEWPRDKRDALAKAVIDALKADPQNQSVELSPDDVHNMFEQNPSYIQLCDLLEQKGFKFYRGHFARQLLTSVPDLTTSMKGKPYKPPQGPSPLVRPPPAQTAPALQKRVSFAEFPKASHLPGQKRGAAGTPDAIIYSTPKESSQRSEELFQMLGTSAPVQNEAKSAPGTERPAPLETRASKANVAPRNERLNAKMAAFARSRQRGAHDSSDNPNSTPKSTSYKGKEKAVDSHEQSIIDHDYANTDFLAKYPPLTSLRRAKTVGSLEQTSGTRDQLNTKRALTRYPSISQLESPRRGQNEELVSHTTWYSPPPWDPESQASIEPTVWPSMKPPKNSGIQNPSFSIDTRKVDVNEDKVLPGAWPDKLEDSVTLPLASNVSSRSFFGSTEAMDATPRPARPVSPALSCRNTSPPKDSLFAPTAGLRRAKTVTTANPAARLNKPFDPGFDASRMEPSDLGRGLPTRAQTVRGKRSTQPSSNQNSTDWYSYQAPPSTSRLEPPSLWSHFQNEVLLSPAKPENQTKNTFKAPQTRTSQVVPGAWPYPTVPKPSSRPPFNHFGPRPMRSEPNFARPRPATENHTRGGPLPMPTSKVDECVKALRRMGYGMRDPNEAARLNVYASATGGEVMDAVTMIEDDREAAEAIKLGTIRTL